MLDDNKKLKKIIFISIISLILLFIICVIIIVRSYNNEEKLINVDNYRETFYELNDYTKYYSSLAMVNEFLHNLDVVDVNGIMSLLHKDYLKLNDISYGNVLEKFNKYLYKELYFEENEVKIYNINNDEVYYLNGSVVSYENSKTKVIEEEFNIILFVDVYNNTFAILPIEEDMYVDLNGISFDIDKNSYNEKIIEEMDEETMCSVYLANYVIMMEENVEQFYNKLSNNLKSKYETIEKFTSDYKKWSNNLSYEVKKCKVKREGKFRVYKITDINDNEYEFLEKTLSDIVIRKLEIVE